MTYILRCISVLIICLLCSACDSSSGDSTLDTLQEGIGKTYDSAKRTIQDYTPETGPLKDAAEGEIEKLFTFEYKVLEIDSASGAVEIENELAKAGLERWECFSAHQHGDKLRILCSRRPKSYLRYIPKLF